MKNLFEIASFLRRVENYRPECPSIQLPIFLKHGRTKACSDFAEYFVVGAGQLARHFICIKKPRLRYQCAEIVCKRGFTGRNPAGNPNDTHDRGKGER